MKVERRALCNIVLHRCQHCRTKHLPGAVDLVRVAGVVVEEVGERGAAVRAAEARGVPRPRPRPLRRDRGVASHQRPPAAPTRTNWPLLKVSKKFRGTFHNMCLLRILRSAKFRCYLHSAPRPAQSIRYEGEPHIVIHRHGGGAGRRRGKHGV